MDQALQRRTQNQPTPRGRRPPLYPRGEGGGGLVYGRRKKESGLTRLWMDSPERATGVGVRPMRWIVHIWEGVIRFEGWGGGHIVQWGGHPPTASRSRLPDNCSQMIEHGVVGAGTPARCSSATGRSRLPEGGPQSAEDVVVESCRFPRAAALQPAGSGCRTAARRVQKMV